MKNDPFARSRRLRVRNLIIGYGMTIVAMGTLLFGLNRWLDLLWAMPVWLAYLMIWQDVQSAHPRRLGLVRRTTPASFGVEFEEVQFPARDGVKLFGYFLKGTRPEAVILAHGLGGGGVTLAYHGRALQQAGYNVLLMDLRAHGHSEGIMIDGVQEINDVLGAVDYLHTRPGIAADRLGALGVSLGGHTVLKAALQTPDLRAVILEGIGPVCLEDHGGKPTTLKRKINYPINWLAYKVANFISGTSPESNTSALQRLQRPLLLISCGRKGEQYFTRLLFAAASEPKELWEIPRAAHAGGYFADMKEYAARMVRFFDTHLAM